MAAKGDIGDVGGVADTISSPPGTLVKPPSLITWTNGTPTLGVGSIAAPSHQGGLNADGGGGNGGDPDTYVGLFTFQATASSLGTGTHVQPSGRGDVVDIFGTPDISVSPPQQVAGFTSWAPATPSLVAGSLATPKGQGDVGQVGVSPTPPNEWNDSAQGAGTLTSWSSGTPTITVGSVASAKDQGDIDAIYSPTEHWAGVNSSWNTATPTLGVGSVALPHGQGSITNDALSLGYGPDTYVWVANPEPPVLALVTSGGVNQLTWTAWPPTAPVIPNITYTIYRAVLGSGFNVLVSGLTSPVYNDSSMVRGTSYQYYVDPVIPNTNVGTFASNVVTAIWGFTNTYAAPGVYTWNGTANAFVYGIQAIGGGGGGGGGAARNTGVAPVSTGGAGGGVALHAAVAAALIALTVTVTVGIGGNGSGGESAGQSGGTTTFGSYFTANGGDGGPVAGSGSHANGGTASSTIAGATLITGGNGGNANAAGINPPATVPSTTGAPSGGGGAGAPNNGGLPVVNGSNGGMVSSPTLVGGSGGQSFSIQATIDGQTLLGGNGTPGNTAGLSVGSGGGGAGYALLDAGLHTGTSVIGGSGGNGGLYGAGGGAGGAAEGSLDSTVTGGAAGNGASGLAIVTTYFW